MCTSTEGEEKKTCSRSWNGRNSAAELRNREEKEEVVERRSFHA